MNIHEIVSKHDVIIDYKKLYDTLIKYVDLYDEQLICELYEQMFDCHLQECECKEILADSTVWSMVDIQTLINKHAIDIKPHNVYEIYCAMEILYKRYSPILKKNGESLNSHTWLCLALDYLKDHSLVKYYFKHKKVK
jgi:hypothetical protein